LKKQLVTKKDIMNDLKFCVGMKSYKLYEGFYVWCGWEPNRTKMFEFEVGTRTQNHIKK